MKFQRAADKYFEGFERVKILREDGKGVRTEYVYRGDWYGFPGGKPQNIRMKLSCAGLSAAALAAYIAAQLTPAVVGMSRIFGSISALAFIPFMFEIVAFCTFLPAGERWIMRVLRDGYRALTLWAKIQEGLLGVFLLLQLGLTIWYGGWSQELHCILLYALAFAAQTGMLILILKNPAELLEKGTPAEAAEDIK